MFFSIETSGDVPIYEQIVRQVKLAVADGVLTGGQMVPSVRQLASELAINSLEHMLLGVNICTSAAPRRTWW